MRVEISARRRSVPPQGAGRRRGAPRRQRRDGASQQARRVRPGPRTAAESRASRAGEGVWRVVLPDRCLERPEIGELGAAGRAVAQVRLELQRRGAGRARGRGGHRGAGRDWAQIMAVHPWRGSLLEHARAPAKARHHSANRDPGDLGDLPVGETLELAQHEDLAVLDGQGGHRTVQEARVVGAQRGPFWPLDPAGDLGREGVGRVLFLVEGADLTGPVLSEEGVAAAADHREEPGPGVDAVPAVEVPEGSDVGLLGGVLGIVIVAEERARQALGGAQVRRDRAHESLRPCPDAGTASGFRTIASGSRRCRGGAPFTADRNGPGGAGSITEERSSRGSPHVISSRRDSLPRRTGSRLAAGDGCPRHWPAFRRQEARRPSPAAGGERRPGHGVTTICPPCPRDRLPRRTRCRERERPGLVGNQPRTRVGLPGRDHRVEAELGDSNRACGRGGRASGGPRARRSLSLMSARLELETPGGDVRTRSAPLAGAGACAHRGRRKAIEPAER